MLKTVKIMNKQIYKEADTKVRFKGTSYVETTKELTALDVALCTKKSVGPDAGIKVFHVRCTQYYYVLPFSKHCFKC